MPLFQNSYICLLPVTKTKKGGYTDLCFYSWCLQNPVDLVDETIISSKRTVNEESFEMDDDLAKVIPDAAIGTKRTETVKQPWHCVLVSCQTAVGLFFSRPEVGCWIKCIKDNVLYVFVLHPSLKGSNPGTV